MGPVLVVSDEPRIGELLHFRMATPSSVDVRDLDRGITYAGWVRAYSETGKLRELLLRDAIVLDKTGAVIDVPLLYLARQDSDVHIEFPYREEHRESAETPEGGDHGEHS